MHRFFKTKVSFDTATVGQLVVIFDPEQPYKHGPVVKLHWFNRKGAFVGNHYEFFTWDVVYQHEKGKIFTQLRSRYYRKPFGNVRGEVHQLIHEAFCKVSTWFMKKCYID